MSFDTVIGLEVHVELKTATKLFCSCPNSFSAEPNKHICPVCLSFPGALPRLNEEAVRLAMVTALALNCTVSKVSYFDRKNYFYPDMPKGYQVSQCFEPIGISGFLNIENDAGEQKKVRINRVHIEEDAGKLIHPPGQDQALVDYNRAGVPLVEIVTEPDLCSPGEARRYLEKLKTILEYCAVSDCKMEEGSLRCDANISLKPAGSTVLGSKTELKNMNSFKAVEQALEYEVKRQAEILQKGGEVLSQTLRFDETSGSTMAMRDKLEAEDYRYFPDPELAPLRLSAEEIALTKAALPELADEKAARFEKQYSLSAYDAGVLTASQALAEYFEESLKYYDNPKTLSNWVTGELSSLLNSTGQKITDSKFSPAFMGELLKMIEDHTISGKIAKEVLAKSFNSGRPPLEVVKEEGLLQISDQEELKKLAAQVICANPKSVESYRGGKKKALGFLVGQLMKETKGKANPQLVNEIILKLIEKSS